MSCEARDNNRELIQGGCKDDRDNTGCVNLQRNMGGVSADHAAETVDFDALASSLGISYRSFRYLFAKETGDPPLKYQLGIRLARAKNLLASSKMPVSKIARTLGFNSTWYFSHFFRAQTGLSAAAYRRRHAGHATAAITPSAHRATCRTIKLALTGLS